MLSGPRLRRAVPVALLSLLALGAAVAAPSDGLDAYRWKSRLLLLLAGDPRDPRLGDQLARLRAAEAGVREREVVVLAERPDGTLGEPGQPESAALPDRWRRGGGFQVVLIGKDGGEKARWNEPVDPDRIFAEIDRMPMRRSEMKR